MENMKQTFNIINFLFECELADSKGEAKRLIKQDAIRINDKKIYKNNSDIIITN